MENSGSFVLFSTRIIRNFVRKHDLKIQPLLWVAKQFRNVEFIGYEIGCICFFLWEFVQTFIHNIGKV